MSATNVRADRLSDTEIATLLAKHFSCCGDAEPCKTPRCECGQLWPCEKYQLAAELRDARKVIDAAEKYWKPNDIMDVADMLDAEEYAVVEALGEYRTRYGGNP